MLEPRKNVLDLSCKCHFTTSLHPVVTWEEGFGGRLNSLTAVGALGILRLSILLCLTPDDFTRQWEPLGSERVKYGFCGSVPTIEERIITLYFKNKKMV